MKLNLLITTTLFLLCLKLFFNRKVFEVLRHVIIKRSRLQNKAYKTENPLDILNFEKEHNYVTKLNKTVKLKYFENLKLVKDNKPFWGKCKPYCTIKLSKMDKRGFLLNKKGKLLLKNKDFADKINEYLDPIVDA